MWGAKGGCTALPWPSERPQRAAAAAARLDGVMQVCWPRAARNNLHYPAKPAVRLAEPPSER